MYKFDTEEIKNSLEESNFPKSVVVETTAYCNLRCIMCPQGSMKREKGTISSRTFKKIVDEVALKAPETPLWLAIMGEPLMQSSNLPWMISYAKAMGLSEVDLNTNAVLLTPGISKALIEARLDKILISIDALTQGTYNKIRVGGSFSQVVYNTSTLISLRKAIGSEPPEVIVQFIVMDENEGEVEDFKRFWLKQGATVKIRPKLGWGSSIETKNLELDQKDRTYPCPWLVRETNILWDGRFSQCDGDYEGLYSPGDIETQTIEEVWNGELKLRRQKHWDGDFTHPLCKECKDWQIGKAEFYYP